MGTPANIIWKTKSGEYTSLRVNYDGYPKHIGPWLAELDTVENAVARLEAMLAAHGWDWRSLDAKSDEGGEWYDDEDDPMTLYSAPTVAELSTVDCCYLYFLNWDSGEVEVYRGTGEPGEATPFLQAPLNECGDWKTASY